MRAILLGTAAGGGFPQWNCHCPNCRIARAQPDRARPRGQSGAALSADARYWFLLNASPDLPAQIEATEPLRRTDEVRGSAIAGVLLTDADLDHTLGLLLLREGLKLHVHCTAAVWRALSEGLHIPQLLARYCTLQWHEPPSELRPLLGPDGSASGLLYHAFPVPGFAPCFCGRGDEPGCVVGYRLVDPARNAALVYLPHIAALDRSILKRIGDCDALLLDGTFWSDDEMRRAGAGQTSAREMGHLPVGGAGGSLEAIADLPIRHKVYVHINNTNPMLLEDSPERRAVEAAGAGVGWDGMELDLAEASQ